MTRAGSISIAAGARRPDGDRLRIPFGVGADGRPVELDIKESAQGGMGPHGLVIGATGSGKSELLRTLVLAMVASHSPDELNAVLVDFKGGATFLGFEDLPHVSAVITNLEEELILVDRMQDAIAGEINRRQELLRHAGNYASRRDYEAAREGGARLDPLPALWIVVDEFSELLSAKPEFLDLFVMIGRLGRSLGVHLLLASQRLEEGRLRGLDTHLSYRIGLRTFSTGESRSVLGVPDAYELPPAPGHGYLKFATEPLQRFQVAYAGAPYRPPTLRERSDGVDEPRTPATVFVARIAAFSTLYAEPRTAEPVVEPVSLRRPRTDQDARPVAPEPGPAGPTGRRSGGRHGLRGGGSAAGAPGHDRRTRCGCRRSTSRRAWTRCCPGSRRSGISACNRPTGRGVAASVPPSVSSTSPTCSGGTRCGSIWPERAGTWRWWAHRSRASRPCCGSLIAAFSLTHTPDQAQFYCLDLGGGGLASIDGLPHVGGVAARLSADAVRRTVGEMTSLLDQRERLLRRTRRRLDADLPAPAGRRADPGGPVRARRLPRRRRLGDAARGVRVARDAGGHVGREGARLRDPCARLGGPVDGFPHQHQGLAADPAGTAGR